jgi:predicted nucleic acid-binding protein
MASDVFVDSAGLYALADHRDPARKPTERIVSELLAAGRHFVITDYILDEAATLAKARQGSQAALRLLEIPELSRGFDFVWVGPERFEAAKAFFRRHADHGYSFTDCTSFVVMRELGLADALTTDRHFREAGFKPLLPVA